MSRSVPLRRRSPIAALALGLALLLAAGAARPLIAQDADVAAIAAYRLTEAKLDQFTRSTRALMELAKDPAVRARAAAMEAQDDGSDSKSIADVVAQLESIPGYKKAVASSGMTTREYIVFQFAFMQAAMAQAMMEQYGAQAQLPAEISKENVEFVRTHKAQLEQLTAEMKKLQESVEADGAAAEPPPQR
ncbi:MAG TPA: hypothetical protein VFS08_02020 [Gemmatimonadaceae bacterium]|nr:hypothetical protein [Gemmatimonadaceae bacterium]